MAGKDVTMSEGKYGKYLVDAPIMRSVAFPQITQPQVNIFGGDHLGGVKFTMNWSYLTEPFAMTPDTHSHDFDQVICVLGGDPMNIREFGGEVEMFFGEELERHVITSPTYIYVPAGVVHYPLNILKINKPIMYMDFPLTARYTKKPKSE
jgi:hypothetical protein